MKKGSVRRGRLDAVNHESLDRNCSFGLQSKPELLFKRGRDVLGGFSGGLRGTTAHTVSAPNSRERFELILVSSLQSGLIDNGSSTKQETAKRVGKLAHSGLALIQQKRFHVVA